MRILDMLTLYEYNYWANKRILDTTSRVSREQFVAPIGYGYGSLRNTLFHTLDGERSWRMLIQHSIMDFTDIENATDLPEFDALQQNWREEELAMRAYLAGLSDDDMTGLVRYTVDGGLKRERVLWHCLFHVVNHGSQHRSEAAEFLTRLGHSPGDLDFTFFLNENPSVGKQ